MREDVPLADMDMEDTFLEPDDIDEEIEIIDEAELLEANGIDQDAEDGADDGEGGDAGVSEKEGEWEEREDEDFEPIQDDSRTAFTSHNQAVLCCCLSQETNVAVSGGQDDKAFIWNTSDGRVLFECGDHKDSVTCVGLSHKETFAATCDMSGFIQIWRTASGERVLDYDVGDLQWIDWHPVLDNVLLVGTESGAAWLIKVAPKDQQMFKVLEGFGVATTAGKFTSNGTKAVMGYDDGAVRVYDVKTRSVVFAVTDAFSHKGSVTAIDVKRDDSLIASASIDGTWKLLNGLSGKVICTFQCGDSSGAASGSDDSVESISFCESLPVAATATVNGVIEIWDLSTQMRRCCFGSEAGLSKLKWDLKDPFVVWASGLDGVLRSWDARTGVAAKSFSGHSDHILDFALSRSGSIIVTASEDSTCRVFES